MRNTDTTHSLKMVTLKDIVAAFEAATGERITEGMLALVELDYYDFECPTPNDEILEDVLRHWARGWR
tara:strand:- start:1064 stop:1267 length:204 start_codon:yes stop_codon:yes gene_type:complete